MTDETIVAIYDTPAHANLAAADLREAGVPDSAISVHAGTIDPAKTGETAAPAPREQGFWSRLFGGMPDHDTAVYDRSVDNGASVLTVRTTEAQVDQVLAIIESHDPVDVDDRPVNFETSADQPAATRTDKGTVRLFEDDMDASRRVVNRGGTRIRRFVADQGE